MFNTCFPCCAAAALPMSKKRKQPSSPTAADGDTQNVAARRLIASVTGSEVQHLLKILTHVQLKLQLTLGTLPTLDLAAPRTQTNGGKTPKHIAQHSSLIRHLQRFNLTSATPSLFVEFGSGVGRFSSQLQEETNAEHYHLMVDRETFKTTRLRDATMAKRSTFNSVQRITTDIRHLDLSVVMRTSFGGSGSGSGSDGSSTGTSRNSTNTNTSTDTDTAPRDMTKIPMVALSKHLCGEGFDMALTTLFEYHKTNVHRALPTVCMTPCCHCLCTWEHFIYQRFFLIFGLTESHFEAMCAISQWASLKFKDDDTDGTNINTSSDGAGLSTRVLTREVLTLLNNVEHDRNTGSSISSPPSSQDKPSEEVTALLVLDRQIQLLSMSGTDFELNLTRREKRKIGRACKECIDVGRVCGILNYGYSECHMFRYTENSTEDLLMVCR